MIDKKTESSIIAVKSFLEFWVKFHSLYADLTSKDIITKDEERKFLETKVMMKNKYDELKGAMDYRYSLRGRMTDPVGDILGIESIHFISEKNLRRFEDGWRDSYVFLNNILERLKSKKRRLEGFNPVGVFFKRILERR